MLFRSALCLLSGIPCESYWEIANRYRETTSRYWSKNDVVGPWWLVKTPAGMICIGWRTQVIEIDWSDTRRPLPTDSITTDDVIKDPMLVHAWSYAKAVEYLTALWRELQRPPASESDHK